MEAGFRCRLLKSYGDALERDADLLCTQLSNHRVTLRTAACSANPMAATAVAVSVSLPPLLRLLPSPLWLRRCSARRLPLLQTANPSAKFAWIPQRPTQQSHAAIAYCVPAATQAPSSRIVPFADLRLPVSFEFTDARTQRAGIKDCVLG